MRWRRNKRGSHLALSLERLASLCGDRLLRIGLSATQKPIDTVARFLVGTGPAGAPPPECTIVDIGHRRARDLALEVPSSPLEAVMSAEVWEQVYERLAGLIEEHRTTLIFVNTRRMAERVASQLTTRLGEKLIAAHHGSMSKEHRLDAERRLQRGELKALVATASLELGIDIGEVEPRVPAGLAALDRELPAARRAAPVIAVDGTPKGRLFPQSRDDLVECAALVDSANRGELDRLVIPEQPLDVLAQQIVAEVGARECSEDELLALLRRAWPYRELEREQFTTVVGMLAEGFTSRRGRRGALIHHDAVNGLLRGRRGARLTALTSGGTIPDNADYQVLLEPESQIIGSVNEDWAVESMAGDVFQLGNATYRILRVERGVVRVEDAHGATPSIPFWLGEAPGRSDELSVAVSRFRADMAKRLQADPSGERALRWLMDEIGIGEPAALQLVEYLRAGHAALGCLPTQDTIVLERFFDEAGGMQLVIHSPYGSRINRAWGLALRKRFCRKFNFELQAAATEDNIVLSLTTAHSFELGEVARYLHSASVRQVLIQAMLDAPMFITRWRWVAGVSLALPRFRGGRKVPPQLARMNAEDLIASVFPDQIACAENLVGEREVPDHPLVNQTISDCLTEAMDIEGLQRLLAGIESGAIRVVARDLTEPSPLALEVLSARPYAFLDDAPLEERRTQAVMARRWLDPETAADLGRLDPEAIERVRAEAWPEATNRDELHDALVWFGFLTEAEALAGAGWSGWLAELAARSGPRACTCRRGRSGSPPSVCRVFRALWPDARLEPAIAAPAGHAEREWSPEEALVEIVRGRLEGLGPVALSALAAPLGLEQDQIAAALIALEAEGFAMRGRFSPGANEEEWCERRLLARIHTYTIKRLRAEIEPVAARDFLRFLFAWQRVADDARMEGPDALDEVVGQLEGFGAAGGSLGDRDPARAPRRLRSGLARRPLPGRTRGLDAARAPQRTRRTAASAAPRPCARRRSRCWRVQHVPLWTSLNAKAESVQPSPRAQQVVDFLRQHGASFFDEMAAGSGLLRSQLEEALAELVALGLVTSDSFAGLRALLVPSDRRQPRMAGAAGAAPFRSAWRAPAAGRWCAARLPVQPASASDSQAVEHLARTLLRRYGVVFWRLLEREAGWLPPWRDLLRVYRTLERRGEIRGGRFVAGFSGEQFALPEAVGALREARRKPRFRRAGLAVRRRPAQPRRHPDARGEARGADRQPRALPRRAPGRAAGGRRGAVPRDAGARHRMAGPHRPAALGHADRVRPPGLVSRGRAARYSGITCTMA